MYNINIPGIPDLSNLDLSQFNIPGIAPPPEQQAPAQEQQAPAQEQQALTPAFDNPLPQLDFSNIDLSQFNLPNQPPPAMVAPPPEVLPAPVAPAPQFDPYAGMTQADLAEIGMVAPLSQTLPAPAPAPQPSAPTGIETMAPNFTMTEDFMLPADQQALMPATAPARDIPVEPTPQPAQVIPEEVAADQPTNVNEVAQGLINTAPITLPNGETFDIRDLDLSGLDLTGLGGQGVSTQPAQGQTPAQTVNTRADLANIPPDYFTGASDYYTDGQLAEMGIEPGTVVSTGANPQQPAGTQIDLTPEQQGAIDAWVESNPAGSVVETPFGNISLPDFSQYTGGNTTPSTNVAAAQYVIQNLVPQASETARGGRVATTFGGPSNAPQQAPRANPFQRPEDGGLASLVPSGG